jgi:hypothetical protein
LEIFQEAGFVFIASPSGLTLNFEFIPNFVAISIAAPRARKFCACKRVAHKKLWLLECKESMEQSFELYGLAMEPIAKHMSGQKGLEREFPTCWSGALGHSHCQLPI